jgi:UDP-N-acetylmuramoyl-tripeptide--D-alanyl-D-alanine ligase
MKTIFRNFCAYLLGLLARAVVRKYKPTIVMVTGSVGKTSTKDAVAASLSQSFFVRASEKSYNSEFGVPLTILGSKNPWTSPIAWTGVFVEACALIFLPNHYPNLLVLEVGADRPGDLKRILRIATPDVVVVTRLPEIPVHVEAYATPAAVREEEFVPAYALAPDAPLILCAEDDFARAMSAPLLARVSTFGLRQDATVHIENPELEIKKSGKGSRVLGMKSSVRVEGEIYPLHATGSIGLPQLYSPAAALATALSLGVSVKHALKGLAGYVPPPGRARLLEGKNQAILIDDSYNASPASVEEALHTLSLVRNEIPHTRRIAVLGDMLELGRYSSEEHQRVGKLVPEFADVLISVGARARTIATSAKDTGMNEDATYSFSTSLEASGFLEGFIKKDDVILIKGSQSIRTEKIVENLLADSNDRRLLVRQDPQWRAK